MGYFLFTQVCSREEVGPKVNDPTSDLPKIKVNYSLFLTILLMKDDICLERYFFYVLYFLCFVNYI